MKKDACFQGDEQLLLHFAPCAEAAVKTDALPVSWREFLPAGIEARPLAAVKAARQRGEIVYPPEGQLFRALELVQPSSVKVVILGQDPYHEEGQAMGLAFAVPQECAKLPPSLKNILKEYETDLGMLAPKQPDLTKWARAGVLLLNTILSVKGHQAFSHQNIGWEEFTDAIIRAVSALPERVVFLLWGSPAQSKRPLLNEVLHSVLASPHPSPLSAYRGFFGSRPFSRANELLVAAGRSPVDWQL